MGATGCGPIIGRPVVDGGGAFSQLLRRVGTFAN